MGLSIGLANCELDHEERVEMPNPLRILATISASGNPSKFTPLLTLCSEIPG